LVLGGWTAVTLAGLACIPRIVVDTDYLSFFDPRSAVRRDFADVSRLLVGAMPIYVTLDGGAEGAFRAPENLRALERLQRRVEAVPGVSATISAVDFVRALNRTVERDDPAAEVVPATRSGVADVLFLLPKARLRRFANANHSAVNLLVRTGVSGSDAVRDLEAALRRALADAALPPELRPAITGNTIVFNRGSDAIASNQLASFLLTAAAIGVLVCAAFRSLRFGVVAMAPNLVPVVLFFGLLGAGLAPLSLPTSLIASVALGIAIDDTAHFLTAYRRVRAGGAAPEAAVRRCLAELGKPVAITSLMLTAGYLVLCFSGFATLREFGYLSALTMAICLSRPSRWRRRGAQSSSESAKSPSASVGLGSRRSMVSFERVSSRRSSTVDSVGTQTPPKSRMRACGERSSLLATPAPSQ
jgi:predicted RND superfamily exporter protein